ncbi:hemerythrin domain-containing protein [Actinomadura sp. 3N407]|uniref:hemerythrin domain-containing protein n=1 Tax=Actinomadura sp. 3N407 TaxID=3457423 RepID=UPI003FCD7038
MPKIDLYRNVHMGQRQRLFTLAIELGSADADDTTGLSALTGRCLAMTRELREHAEHEDSFVHPLLREQAPAAAKALDTEHERLEAALDDLDAQARHLPDVPPEDRGEARHRAYLALNGLISAYLAHLDAEETIAMPALQERCSDEELQRVFHAFQASRTPEQRMTDLQEMLPALPPSSRASIARQVLGAGPAAQAGRTLRLLAAPLAPADRTRLYDDVGAPES